MRYLIRNPLKRRLVFCLDKVGGCFPFKGDGNSPQTINSVLLIRLDHLGDVLLTTPAIKSLKRQFPQARITMVVKEWSFEVVRNNPHIDKIVIFNPFWTIPKREETNIAGVAGISRLVRTLRREHFDLSIDFKGDFPYKLRIHEIDKNLKLLTPLGINSGDSNMELYVDDEDVATVEQIFEQERIDLKRRTIAVHYGGASRYKCWDVEKFVALAEELTKDGSTNVLIFGGPYERKTLQLGKKPGEGIFTMPDMTICQMAAAFRRCDQLVCNDSGPMHVGLAVGTPTVAIFGPTFFDRFGPKDLKKNKIIHSHLACGPCWHPDTPIGCYERHCFKSIDVAKVLTGIGQLDQTIRTESR